MFSNEKSREKLPCRSTTNICSWSGLKGAEETPKEQASPATWNFA